MQYYILSVSKYNTKLSKCNLHVECEHQTNVTNSIGLDYFKTFITRNLNKFPNTQKHIQIPSFKLLYIQPGLQVLHLKQN